MTAEIAPRFPILLSGRRKFDVRTQFAAICWRREKGKIRILLITSRDTGRWIIPKGWPMDGKTPSEAAAQEAWEEAGVTGVVGLNTVGVYSYVKPLDRAQLPCLAMVFPIHVKQEFDDWPEAHQRTRKWMSRKKAARLVAEPELQQILLNFQPEA